MWKKLAKCIGCGLVTVAICLASIWLYVSPKLNQHKDRMLSGSLMCFGWPRTGMMTESEIELFNQIRELCENRDVAGLNSLLYNEKGAVELSCHSTSSTFIEPKAPNLKVVVKNISSAPVHIPEFSPERINITSNERDGQWENEFLLASRNDPRFFKTLAPGESFESSLTLNIEGYGKHMVSLSLSTIKWKTITQKSSSLSSPVIARGHCNFEWKPRA